MRFSIRLLITVTLFAGLLIQDSMARKDIARLKSLLDSERVRQSKVEPQAVEVRQRTQVCEAVLESEQEGADGGVSSEAAFQLARKRYQMIPVSGGAK